MYKTALSHQKKCQNSQAKNSASLTDIQLKEDILANNSSKVSNFYPKQIKERYFIGKIR